MTEALAAAIDGLLDADASTLTDAQLQDTVVALQRETSRLAAVRAQLVSSWDARKAWADDGSKSPAAALSHQSGVSPTTARAECRRARRLRSMPLTAAALAAGEISADHADRLCTANEPAFAELFARDEHVLVGFATTLSFRDFERVVQHWRNLANDDRAEDRARKLHERRYFNAVPTFGGAVDLRGRLDPVNGAIVMNELERLEQQMFEADWAVARAEHGPDATPEQLPRTAAQRRADALVEMARRSGAMPAGARRPRPLITVLIGYETLAGRVCELASGAVLTPGEVAPLIHEADIERVVFDGPSRVIDVGARQRLFVGGLRRAIEVRDRHCTHGGCDVPADRCDVDHITPYAEGGLTTQENGRLRCPVHNRRRARRRAPPARSP